MPYPSALSGTNQTKYRGGVYSALRNVVTHTPTVMLSFNPNANADGSSAAQIGFDSALSGATTNVEPYMSVYVTPTADYVDDLQTQPENCIRTYVRKDPTSAILYIGLTAFQWTTSSYVTVVDNFEVHEKKTVVDGSVVKKNVDISLREPLPRIYDFYHDVVIATGSTYDYSPTPSFEAMDANASISSYDWTVIENGTVTQAASTSATPTFTLDLGTHWLHLTVTDSNNNSNVTVAFVAVVPDNYASVITEIESATVSNDLNNGTSADIVAYADTSNQLSTLVPGAFGIIFTTLNFTDGTTLQVIEMCGWFDAPVSLELAGDETFGVRKQYSTQLIGVREAAKHIRIPAFPFKYNETPTAWGHVTRCTVYDGIWYTLSEHSTITQVATLELPSSYTNYQYNPSLQIPSGAILDSVAAQAFRASGGQMNYSPNGEIVFTQSALYMTSGRDGLTTYATYSASEVDAIVFVITRPSVNNFSLSSVKGGFATWNTTTNLPRVYRSIAPANETPAALFEEVDGVIMVKNLSDTNANIEAGKLAANHFFAANESIGVQVDFVSGYISIVPSCFQWHKFTIAATDLLDGSSFDSSTRLLCLGISSRFDVSLSGIITTATFRAETDGGDNYARETEFVPSTTEQVHSVYPVGTYSPFLDDFDIQSGSEYYGSDFDDNVQGYEDPTLPPEIAAQNAGNNPGVTETLHVPLRGGAISTSFNTTLSKTYTIRVSNDGLIGGDNWCQEWTGADIGSEFTITAGTSSGSGVASAVYTPSGLGVREAADIYLDFGAEYPVTDIELAGTLNWGGGLTYTYSILEDLHPSSTVISRWTEAQTPNLAGTNTLDWSGSRSIQVVRLSIAACGGASCSGDSEITRVQISGTGTSPTFSYGSSCSIANNVRGDAFFYDYQDSDTGTAYAGQGGLNLDGSGITHSQPYNASHVYEFTVTGTGNPFAFSYFDSVDSDLTNNENVNLKVEVIG